MKKIKEQEKEQRRNYILDAAEKLFFIRGYDDVSMDDIANEVGFNKATLYLYFENKESLFVAVVLRGAQILHSMVYESIKNCTTGIKIMDAIGREYFNFVDKYPEYNRAYLYFLSGRFDLEDREAMNKDAKEILRLRQDTFILKCNAIKSGIEEGEIRQDVDPIEMTVFLTMIVKGLTEMRPEVKKVLEGHGISQNQFFRDAADSIHRILMNTENGTKKDTSIIEEQKASSEKPI